MGAWKKELEEMSVPQAIAYRRNAKDRTEYNFWTQIINQKLQEKAEMLEEMHQRLLEAEI